MAYKAINYEAIGHEGIKDIFRRCDLFLRDVYGMFELPPKHRPDAGGGNWSIAVILFCLIDGLAKYIYPIRPRKAARTRFEDFIVLKLLKGDQPEVWKRRAASTIFDELRGLLVHELAVDKREQLRPQGMAEPAVAKWEPFPEDQRNIDWIEEQVGTDFEWPIFTVQPYEDRQREVLCCAALYGSLRSAVMELTKDTAVLGRAAEAYPSLIVQAQQDESVIAGSKGS